MVSAKETKSYEAFQENLKELERLVAIRETLLGTGLDTYTSCIEKTGKQILQKSDDINENVGAALGGTMSSKDTILSTVERLAGLCDHWVRGSQFLNGDGCSFPRDHSIELPDGPCFEYLIIELVSLLDEPEKDESGSQSLSDHPDVGIMTPASSGMV